MYIVYFIIAGRRGNGAAPVSTKKMLITIGIICGVLIGAPILFAIFSAIISVASTAADRAEVARQQKADKSSQFIIKRPNPSNAPIDEMRKQVEFPFPIDYDDSPSDAGFRSPAVRQPSSDFGGSLQPDAANAVVPEPATAQKKKPSDFKPLKYALDGDGKIKIDALKSSYLQNVARRNDANLDGFIDESEFGTLYQECPPIAHVDHSEFEKSDFAAQAPGETTPNVAPTGVSTVPTKRQTPEEIAAQKAESDARFDQTFNKTLQISDFVDGKLIVAKSVGDQGVPLEALQEAGFPEDVVEIYRQVDKNGDGFISHSEDGEAFHLKHEARVKKMREKHQRFNANPVKSRLNCESTGVRNKLAKRLLFRGGASKMTSFDSAARDFQKRVERISTKTTRSREKTMNRRDFQRGLLGAALGGFVAATTFGDANANDVETNDKKELFFRNPNGVAGDPSVLRKPTGEIVEFDGRYWLYFTSEGANVRGFEARSTVDFVSWKDEGVVFDTAGTWARDAFWAPEGYEINGKFYLFFSAQNADFPWTQGENFNIGVAIADSPRGPFKLLKDKPIFEPGYPIIDANLFIDDDGTPYLTFSRCCYEHAVESELSAKVKAEKKFDKIEESWVYGIELTPDFCGVVGEPTLLLRPPVKLNDAQAEWESRSVTSGEVGRRWTEGSSLFKLNGRYYLTYSANFFGGDWYAVGYATSDKPLGTYRKANNNPILEKNTQNGGIVRGTGHGNVFFAPDRSEMFYAYHARTNSQQRELFIDRMRVDEKGILTIDGPTVKPQPVPQWVRR